MFKKIDFKLMIFEKRNKALIPKKFSDFVLSTTFKSPNINKNKQPKPRRIKKKSVKSIKNKRTPLPKNNSLKINANSIIIGKKKKCCSIQTYKQLLQEKKHFFKETDIISDNLTLTFSIPNISNLSTLKTSNETLDDLRYKVELKDCKPISKAIQYYNNIVNSLKDEKNIKEHLNVRKELELFLKFQPLVLIPRFEHYISAAKINEFKTDFKIIKRLKVIEDVSVSSLNDEMSAEMQNMKEETYSGNDSRFESVYLPEFLSQASTMNGSTLTCNLYSDSTSRDATCVRPSTQDDDPLYMSNEIYNIWSTSPLSEGDSIDLCTSSAESCIDSSDVSDDETDNGETYNLVPTSQEIDIKEDIKYFSDFLGLHEKEE